MKYLLLASLISMSVLVPAASAQSTSSTTQSQSVLSPPLKLSWGDDEDTIRAKSKSRGMLFLGRAKKVNGINFIGGKFAKLKPSSWSFDIDAKHGLYNVIVMFKTKDSEAAKNLVISKYGEASYKVKGSHVWRFSKGNTIYVMQKPTYTAIVYRNKNLSKTVKQRLIEEAKKIKSAQNNKDLDDI